MKFLTSRLSMRGLFLLCQVLNCITAVWMALAILVGSKRAWTLMVSYDQLANATFGGHPDETISSRAARARGKGRRWGCILCRLLDALDPDHCAKHLESRFIE